jgi:hypothetical protein
MDHGLLRSLAELSFGGQTDDAIVRARGWLKRRTHFTTGLLLDILAEQMEGRIPVEKSPSIVYDQAYMRRAFEMFPNARFLHVVSHPRTYCEIVMQALQRAGDPRVLPESHWLKRLASYASPDEPVDKRRGVLDPQGGWYALNLGIQEFLATLPPTQKRTIRGEDLLGESHLSRAQVLSWLGLRTDAEALEAMRHPERSAYLQLGPSEAPFGSDVFLWDRPFEVEWLAPRSLEGPLSWREDGQGFAPAVIHMAEEFGYR